MPEYVITMKRSLELTDAERRRRLAACYRILLDCALRARARKTAETGQAFQGNPAPAAQSEPNVKSATE